jgi:hypothetical protein
MKYSEEFYEIANRIRVGEIVSENNLSRDARALCYDIWFSFMRDNELLKKHNLTNYGWKKLELSWYYFLAKLLEEQDK